VRCRFEYFKITTFLGEKLHPTSIQRKNQIQFKYAIIKEMADTNHKPEAVPKEAQKEPQVNDKEATNSHSNGAHPVSPTSSRNNINSNSKKSYKGALVKEENSTSANSSTSQEASSLTTPAESHKQKESMSTSQSPDASSESKADPSKKTSPPVINKPPSVAPWKKQATNTQNNRKKRTVR
jgi:hypothetical protein